jgi:succinate dehydrogenase / fumarate reductase, cytochrome b subunit
MIWIYKIISALSGLFLCLFLVIHLAGNLALLLAPEKAALIFNSYAAYMSSNIFIKLISYGLYLSLILHIVISLYMHFDSKRKKVALKGPYNGTGSSWYSRQMALLGILIAGFLLIHLKDFWYVYVFGSLPVDTQGNKDLYTLVVTVFENPWIVVAYCIGIIALGFHIRHGASSAFMSLGVWQPSRTRFFKRIASIYSIIISVGFIVIPIYLFLKMKFL